MKKIEALIRKAQYEDVKNKPKANPAPPNTANEGALK